MAASTTARTLVSARSRPKLVAERAQERSDRLLRGAGRLSVSTATAIAFAQQHGFGNRASTTSTGSTPCSCSRPFVACLLTARRRARQVGDGGAGARTGAVVAGRARRPRDRRRLVAGQDPRRPRRLTAYVGSAQTPSQQSLTSRSGLSTTRIGVSKSIVGRVRGSWRGHAGQVAAVRVAGLREAHPRGPRSPSRAAPGGLSPTNAAMSMRSKTKGMSSPWQAPSIPVPAGVRHERR